MVPLNISLEVNGMNCGHCSAAVKRALEEIDGISNVSVDLEGKKANFDAAAENLVEKAVRQINEAGYKACVPDKT
jgi:copper chaperone CopZ